MCCGVCAVAQASEAIDLADEIIRDMWKNQEQPNRSNSNRTQ